jgi:toxin ParE1/3/4
MPPVFRTEQSRQDALEIWEYIAVKNPAAADNLIDRIEAHLALLAASPAIGRQRDELARDLRSFPVGNYVIFYRSRKDGVELIRVLHGARDISPRFFG